MRQNAILNLVLQSQINTVTKLCVLQTKMRVLWKHFWPPPRTFCNVINALHIHQDAARIDTRIVKKEAMFRNGVLYTMNCRDRIAVLSEQIFKTIPKGIVTEHVHCTTMSHPMDAAIGREACKAIRKELCPWPTD